MFKPVETTDEIRGCVELAKEIDAISEPNVQAVLVAIFVQYTGAKFGYLFENKEEKGVIGSNDV